MPVKCTECGLFTIRDWRGTDVLELDHDYRLNGKSRSVPGTASKIYSGRPFCLESRFNLPAEFDRQDPPPEEIISVGSKNRECDGFTTYQVGMSPQQHREMKLVQEVQRINRQAREEDVARNLQWRNEEIARTDSWKTKEHEDAEKHFLQSKTDADRRHDEQLEWQRKVEQNVESRFGRSVGFNFANVLVGAALSAGGAGAVLLIQWLVIRLLH